MCGNRMIVWLTWTIAALTAASAWAAEAPGGGPDGALAQAAPSNGSLKLSKAPRPRPGAPEVATRPAAADKPADETPEQKAERIFEEGRDALFRGDYKTAVELLRQASEMDAAKTRYRLYLARAHRYAGNTDQAEKLLEAIVEASPDHAEAGQLLGEMYIRQEKWAEAAKILQRLLRYRHDYPTYHMLAEALYNLDRLDEARKHFQEAIRLHPSSAPDHYQLGNIHLAGNAFALAADAYQKALSLGLRSPVLHYKLGSAYFNLRNYFGQVGEVAVKSGKADTIDGDWYLIEPVPGKTDVFRAAPARSAIYQVAKALETGMADQPDIQFLRANIYLNASRYERAYQMFQKLAAAAPKGEDDKRTREDRALFCYYFAQAAFGVGKYDEYLDLLKKAIALDGAAYKATLVDAYLQVAEHHNQGGDLEGYIKYLQLAVNEAPQKVEPHLKLGYAYEEVRKYPEAMIQWRMVLDLEPDHAKRMELLELIRKYHEMPATAPAPSARKAA